MKRFATVIMGIGMVIAFTGMCFDVGTHPILAIPILAGFAMLWIGAKLEGGWLDEEEDVDIEHFSNVTDNYGTDCGTYNSNGEERLAK